MTLWDYLTYSPILSMLEPWANRVWTRVKENNSPYNNKTALQHFINNVTRNGKYTTSDILNIISAYKLVKNQYPSLSEETKDFTTKMLEISSEISKLDRNDVTAIRLLIVKSIYLSDGTLYNWLHGKDSDGIINKMKANFESISYSVDKKSEIMLDKLETVAEGVDDDLQKYLKYAAILFGSYALLQAIGLVKTLKK